MITAEASVIAHMLRYRQFRLERRLFTKLNPAPVRRCADTGCIHFSSAYPVNLPQKILFEQGRRFLLSRLNLYGKPVVAVYPAVHVDGQHAGGPKHRAQLLSKGKIIFFIQLKLLSHIL